MKPSPCRIADAFQELEELLIHQAGCCVFLYLRRPSPLFSPSRPLTLPRLKVWASFPASTRNAGFRQTDSQSTGVSRLRLSLGDDPQTFRSHVYGSSSPAGGGCDTRDIPRSKSGGSSFAATPAQAGHTSIGFVSSTASLNAASKLRSQLASFRKNAPACHRRPADTLHLSQTRTREIPVCPPRAHPAKLRVSA